MRLYYNRRSLFECVCCPLGDVDGKISNLDNLIYIQLQIVLQNSLCQTKSDL